MRKNQVTITIERFGDQIPAELNADSIRIDVYADSNNIYEALTAAFDKALSEIKNTQRIPEFGRVESNTTFRK